MNTPSATHQPFRTAAKSELPGLAPISHGAHRARVMHPLCLQPSPPNRVARSCIRVTASRSQLTTLIITVIPFHSPHPSSVSPLTDITCKLIFRRGTFPLRAKKLNAIFIVSKNCYYKNLAFSSINIFDTCKPN